MKKIIVLICIAALLISLVCACGGSKSPVEIAESFVGKNASDLISEIGQPKSADYQDSCEMPDAQDGFLEYDGFTVITLKTADGETVQRIDK